MRLCGGRSLGAYEFHRDSNCFVSLLALGFGFLCRFGT